MTVEPGHDPLPRERDPRPTTQSTPVAQPATYNAARHGNHIEESPELLRWRADLLMDEMMMGGVDVSAADGNRTFSGVDAPVVQRPQSSRNGGTQNGGTHHRDGGNGAPQAGTQNGAYRNGTQDRRASDESARGGYENGYENGRRHDPRELDERNGHIPNGYVQPSTDFNRPSEQNGRGYPSPSANYQSARDTRPPERESVEPRNFDVGDAATRSGRGRPDELHRESYRDTARPDTESDYGYGSTARPQPSSQPTSYPPSPATSDYQPYERGQNDNGQVSSQAGSRGYADEGNVRGISAPRQYPDQLPQAQERPAGPVSPTGQRADVERLDDAPPRTDRLYAVEQQYEQFRREQSTNVPTSEIKSAEQTPPVTRPATRPPLPPVEQPTPPPTSPPRVTPPPVDEHTRWATGPEKWEYQDFGAAEQPGEEPFIGEPAAPERRAAPDSAVRNDPAQFVSAMSVMGNNKKRSTLLPRSTELDVDTLHREISDLHGDIAALLPVGNETSERARHLLDKAYSILQSDPSRSAEVEYYMQQVRSIVQRLHQSRKWSDLYRQRLHVYLLGWLGLSAMVLLARFFFQVDLEDMLIWLFGVDADGWVIAHWATFVGTVGAGAFGGALGALYTMRNHARGEHSFFDRKYGLRGLILPFMGLLVGAFGYVIFGLIFALVGINPALSLTAAIVPTMAALAFGFSQESIYGTRG